MTIPSVMRGLIETEDGKVFELDSPKGKAWLESIGSFRYEPTRDGKPYTVRKEGKNGEYWYGCRKIEGKVRKKYIGKSSEVSLAKLEEIAEALEIPAEPRVNKVAQVAEQVAEVAQVAEPRVNKVAQVAEQVAESRVTALELQVVELLKAVKALQEPLLGKSDAGDSLDLLKVDNEVAEQLQNELGNLKAENDELQLQIEREKVAHSATAQYWQEVLKESNEEDSEKILALDRELGDLQEELEITRSESLELAKTCDELRSELSDLKQKSATARDFPDVYDVLNRLKAEDPKTKATPGDIKKILGILEKS